MAHDILMFWNVYETPFGVGAYAASKSGISSVLLPDDSWAKDGVPPFQNFDQSTWYFDRSLKGRRELENYFQESGSKKSNEAACKLIDWKFLDQDKTEFQTAVLKTCADLGFGEICSYGELAERSGFSGSARAAGTVMATNPIPLLIPCHRIVRSDCSVGQYGGGSDMKAFLLEVEGALSPA